MYWLIIFKLQDVAFALLPPYNPGLYEDDDYYVFIVLIALVFWAYLVHVS